MSDFYNWTKTLSYDADITMVCGARGIGKTYGLRLQCIRDFLKNNWRFVIVVRFKAKIAKVSEGFFSRIAEFEEFEGLHFKTHGRHAYIAKEVDSKGKPKWELAGYFVALSEAQDTKEMTFSRVRRIILDEFILDKQDKYRRYLPDEYTKLVTITDSVARENKKVAKENPDVVVNPKVYLLGNALNVVNPYFEAFGIFDLPPIGYSWHCHKMVLLHYVEDKKYSQEKAENTLAGRMYRLSSQGMQNIDNKFLIKNTEHIRAKTPASRFVYGLIWKNRRYGIWADPQTETFYINTFIPPHREEIYALSLEDKELNFRVAKKNEKRIISLYELFCADCVFFDKEATRQALFEIFSLYGARLMT